MIYTVTFNPSLDYHMTLKSPLCSDAPNRPSEVCFVPGGKGINVSAVLNALGCGNTALCFLGGDTGTMLENMLRQRGQQYECVRTSSPTRINVKVSQQVYENEKTYEFNAQGGRLTKADTDSFFAMLGMICTGDTVIISGSTPPSDSELYGTAVDLAASKGAKVIVDTSGEDLIKCAERGVFLLKPNENEIKAALGGEAVPAARQLCRMGAQNVLLSLGERGAVLVGGGGELYCKVPLEMPVLNTVGSGDSMLAGFVYAHEKHLSPKECLTYAVCAGSCNAYTPVNAPFNKQLFENLLEEAEIL